MWPSGECEWPPSPTAPALDVGGLSPVAAEQRYTGGGGGRLCFDPVILRVWLLQAQPILAATPPKRQPLPAPSGRE